MGEIWGASWGGWGGGSPVERAWGGMKGLWGGGSEETYLGGGMIGHDPKVGGQEGVWDQ